MTLPKISVIVPIYKVEKYIVDCVDSIANQTYKNLEIILVDDGSPDNCPAICDEYAEKDPRVVVIHKNNGGLSDARNVGLDRATGEYIGFVDGDDYISPNMYAVLINRLQEHGADMAICNYLCVDESHEPVAGKNCVQPLRNECLTAEHFIEGYSGPYGWYYVVAWNKLYKKELFDQLRYPLGKQHEDEFLIHHIVYRCKIISCVEDSLYFYLQRSESIMAQQFSVKTMDIGEALMDQYHFAKGKGLTTLKNFAVRRLSYKMERWKDIAQKDKECRKKYEALRKKSRYLLYEKAAWEDYSFRARTYYRLELMAPGFAKTLQKYIHRDA